MGTAKIITPTNGKTLQILLLTNRDSDNVGDQVIEACDISLIKTVMKNLNINESNYKIKSHAAGIIPKKYIETREPQLLNTAINLIQNSDLIIFGGAPLFNYLYQIFYERTAITLELARQYNKPVIFSAIGIESYDEDNPKCQRLKDTLNFECVKQITTRDGFLYLQNYRERDGLVIDKVSDPAVFTSDIFKNYNTPKRDFSPKKLGISILRAIKNYNTPKKVLSPKKKIGIFVLRANGFKDNKVNFSKQDAASLWINLINELEKRGYDYELLTSGHFGDEAFLDYMIRNHGVKASKCIFNINTPEQLIQRIASYDGIISCRLHPSIIAFSLDVPSIGLIWNAKVSYFYESIGYSSRTVDVTTTTAQEIISKLEQGMHEGIKKDKDYLMSIYNTLFTGIQNVLFPGGNKLKVYTYSELTHNIFSYPGTSEKEQLEKLQRKFRRTYGKYNEIFEQNTDNKKRLLALQTSLECTTKSSKCCDKL